jgi:hypothetical protein
MNRYPWGGDRLGTQELEIGFKDSESLNAISTGTK